MDAAISQVKVCACQRATRIRKESLLASDLFIAASILSTFSFTQHSKDNLS
jgi:hypothetical protein